MNVEIPTSDVSSLPRFRAASLPLVEELTPAPDAWEACRRLAHLPHLLFLDSASRLPELGRYSYLMADPFRWLLSRRGQVRVVDSFGEPAACFPDDPFSVLTRYLHEFTVETVPGLPPFQGGAAGLFGYDLCHHIERLPRPRLDEFEVPDLAVGLYDWVIAFDHQQNRAWLISTGLPEPDAARRSRRASSRLAEVRQWLHSRSELILPRIPNGMQVSPAAFHPVPGLPNVASSFDREGYLQTIRRAIEYVHAGDCFQVNIAQRLLSPATLSPLELYGRLRERNPAPFAGYFDLGDFVIASASPERFLSVASGDVETRPIKGTRPRGQTPSEDAVQIAELQRSAKDRAENVMIVDLLRNDLGRVCQYGTVKVEAVCRIETYKYVHHLVSAVKGRLRQGLGPIDLLRAAFPGGSVTGAPKVRAMEIIAELEPTARGPYCGSLGWIGFDGSMDTNLLIRTFTIGRGWMQFPVGGGIVADSVPEQEYAETWHKAEGLLRAEVNQAHGWQSVDVTNIMILEGIVTTVSAAGEINIAPMGPRVDAAMQRFLLRPFNTSQTYRNLKSHGDGVLHVTDDVLLLAKAALGAVQPVPAMFPAQKVRGWVLQNACRYYELRVVSLDDSTERVSIQVEVLHTGRLRDFFGFNRAKHAVVEAAILATRTDFLPLDEIEADFRKLAVLVDKTGGEQEHQAFDFLRAHLAKARATKEAAR